MQDETIAVDAQQANEENKNNETPKEGVENEKIEGQESASQEAPQEKSGELPEDFKGRLAREKRRHERSEAELRAQLTQANQAMQALLQSNNQATQQQSQPEVISGGQDIKKEVREAMQEFATQAQQERVNAEINTKLSQLAKDMENADDKYPDFDELRKDPTLVFPQHLLQQVALSSSNAMDVIYFLVKNRDKLQSVLNTHPALQSGEIARISAELLVNKKQSKGATKAPPPANALATNPAANAGRIRDNASV